MNAQPNFIEDIIFRINDSTYIYSKHKINYLGSQQFYFYYEKGNDIAEISVITSLTPNEDFDFNLSYSNDYNIIDSFYVKDDTIKFKIQFKNLNESKFIKFAFQFSFEGLQTIEEIPLQALHPTFLKFYPKITKVYIGEELTYELVSNNFENLKLNFEWKETKNFSYRFSIKNGINYIHITPNNVGNHLFELSVYTINPWIANNVIYNRTNVFSERFVVKEGLMTFLEIDKNEFVEKESTSIPFTIQIDNHKNLNLDKTYRIENKEDKGGALIAEFFTRRALSNNKILCDLRLYGTHRKSNGYLYIKDGDIPMFITNFDVIPKTSITNIFIQRLGKDWEETNVVRPGEKIKVKLQGKGLQKSLISLVSNNRLPYDSIIKSENDFQFELQIPKDISTRRIEIFNFEYNTGKELVVKDFQRPKVFDFIELNFIDESYIVEEINKPILYSKTLRDLIILFNADKIDEKDEFYGKQFLKFKFRVFDKAGTLLEVEEIENIVITPSSESIRGKFYENELNENISINLNSLMNVKTYDLKEWARIDIEISNSYEKYGGIGYTKKVQVYLKKDYDFDIDVSFPAGLLVLKSGAKDVTNFGGISFAMLAQFSFYYKNKINKYKPYKVGLGFIAIDAFNFTADNSRQDIGIVCIGSLYPNSNKKLSFPLFMGFGYLIKEGKPFFLVGPGIRVKL